jgi:hypothetical protein
MSRKITVGPQPGDERPHWREPPEAKRAYESACLELGDLLASSRWMPLSTKMLPTKIIAALCNARDLRKKAEELQFAWERKIERRPKPGNDTVHPALAKAQTALK